MSGMLNGFSFFPSFQKAFECATAWVLIVYFYFLSDFPSLIKCERARKRIVDIQVFVNLSLFSFRAYNRQAFEGNLLLAHKERYLADNEFHSTIIGRICKVEGIGDKVFLASKECG